MTYYVNEYRVSQVYGGPEEGGWWFTAGTFEANHGQFVDLEEAIAHRDWLHNTEVEARGHNYRDRYSVLGDEDTEFAVDDQPGEDFPKEYPHYE